MADSSSSEEEDDFNFDALAAEAISAAGLVPRAPGDPADAASKPRAPKPLSLEVSIGDEQLYMCSSSEGTAGGWKRSRSTAFDTTALPGVSRLQVKDFAEGCAAAAPEATVRDREVRSAPVRPLDDKKLRSKEARKLKEERLDRWFGLRKKQLTPELAKELKTIKMRANLDPKRFYKGNDSKELPTYFTVATEVGGGMAPVGMRSTVRDPRPGSGRSLLDSVLRDERVQEWTTKRQMEVGNRGMASTQSGHGKRAGKSTKRGGAWKKTKRG